MTGATGVVVGGFGATTGATGVVVEAGGEIVVVAGDWATANAKPLALLAALNPLSLDTVLLMIAVL
jgi:Cft2 family RNA processing exonuclease